MSTRRDFLKQSSLASAALLMPRFLSGLNHNSLAANGRRLIIIQQSGGNDGLNAFVPFRNDDYYTLRPKLAIDQVIQLNDEQGINAALDPLMKIFERGEMGVFNAVGYPNPNRSHFRSMDIWHSASDSNQYLNTGWLGRYLDNSCKGCANPHAMVEVDDTLSLAMKGQVAAGMAVKDPRQLYLASQDPYLKALAHMPSQHPGHDELDYLYKTLTETLNSAEYLYEKSKTQSAKGSYPAHAFGKSLKVIAELINSGVDTSVFYASLSGFDTHVNQRGQHDRLLGVYAKGVAALVEDLKQNGHWDDTLILTFSEFGRRVKQNASGGTDHGKANNLVIMGGKLKEAGIYNPAPDLQQLDNGDLAWQIDFRQIYATVLNNWLEADAQAILGQSFKPLGFV